MSEKLLVESGGCLLTAVVKRGYIELMVGHHKAGFVKWSVAIDSATKTALLANLEEAEGIRRVQNQERTPVNNMPVTWNIDPDPEGETPNLFLVFSWEWREDFSSFTQINKGEIVLAPEDADTLHSILSV